MNTSRRNFLATGLAAGGGGDIWQVDTGPIAFADRTRRFEPAVDSVRLAFAVFNASDFCNFVIEQPTAALRDEKEVCRINHYSHPVNFPAKNRILSVAAR